MKVRMLVKVQGTRDGADWPEIGDTITVPDAEGADLCATGLAEPVKSGKTVETAVAAADSVEPAKKAPARKRAAKKA